MGGTIWICEKTEVGWIVLPDKKFDFFKDSVRAIAWHDAGTCFAVETRKAGNMEQYKISFLSLKVGNESTSFEHLDWQYTGVSFLTAGGMQWMGDTLLLHRYGSDWNNRIAALWPLGDEETAKKMSELWVQKGTWKRLSSRILQSNEEFIYWEKYIQPTQDGDLVLTQHEMEDEKVAQEYQYSKKYLTAIRQDGAIERVDRFVLFQQDRIFQFGGMLASNEMVFLSTAQYWRNNIDKYCQSHYFSVVNRNNTRMIMMSNEGLTFQHSLCLQDLFQDSKNPNVSFYRQAAEVILVRMRLIRALSEFARGRSLVEKYAETFGVRTLPELPNPGYKSDDFHKRYVVLLQDCGLLVQMCRGNSEYHSLLRKYDANHVDKKDEEDKKFDDLMEAELQIFHQEEIDVWKIQNKQDEYWKREFNMQSLWSGFKSVVGHGCINPFYFRLKLLLLLIKASGNDRGAEKIVNILIDNNDLHQKYEDCLRYRGYPQFQYYENKIEIAKSEQIQWIQRFLSELKFTDKHCFSTIDMDQLVNYAKKLYACRAFLDVYCSKLHADAKNYARCRSALDERIEQAAKKIRQLSDVQAQLNNTRKRRTELKKRAMEYVFASAVGVSIGWGISRILFRAFPQFFK